MSERELFERILAAEASIPHDRLKRGALDDRDWARLGHRLGDLQDAPAWLDDTAAMTVAELRAKARRMAQREGLDLLIVDYLHLMTPPAATRQQTREREIAEISRGLKLLAKELAVPVVALAQLNRGVEQRVDKRPLLSDLRESGAVEQDSDIVILLHREEYYDPHTPRKGEADLIVAKNRNGKTGTVTVAAQLHFARFANFAPIDDAA